MIVLKLKPKHKTIVAILSAFPNLRPHCPKKVFTIIFEFQRIDIKEQHKTAV